jgi:hypothetical protein
MSIGFIFGGVPVKVTLPLIVPTRSSGAGTAAMVKAASPTRVSEATFFGRIVSTVSRNVIPQVQCRPRYSGPIGLSSPACAGSQACQAMASGVWSG